MLGIDLWDAGLIPAMFVALLGGLISFVSPCVLPIVPPYLAYMGGVSMDDMSATAQARRRVVLAALFFVLGLSTVFILLGFTASSFGRLFLSNQDWFVSGAGILVMVFGAHFLGVIRIGLLDREARIAGGDRGGSAFGAYILGLAFAFGWTPCLGHFGHNPRARRRYRQSRKRGHLARHICVGPWYSLRVGGGVLSVSYRADGLDEASYDADRTYHGVAALDRWADDGDWAIYPVQLVDFGAISRSVSPWVMNELRPTFPGCDALAVSAV